MGKEIQPFSFLFSAASNFELLSCYYLGEPAIMMNTRLAFWGPIQTVTTNMKWQGKGWQSQRCKYWQRSNYLSFFHSSVFLWWRNAYFNWQIVGCGMNFAYQMGWRKYLIGPYKLVITWHFNPYHHFSNWPCIRGKNHFTLTKLKWVETRFDLIVPTIAYFSMFNVERNWKQNSWNMLSKHLKNYGLNKVREPIKKLLQFLNISN